jgi:shikimate dehydrogenase
MLSPGHIPSLEGYQYESNKHKTHLCALLGDPVEHSLSPPMHNAAFKALGLNFIYKTIRVEKNMLASVLKRLKKSKEDIELRGLSITHPHKIPVMKYLDEIDSMAQRIGAVNTVVYDPCWDKLTGYNTDYHGAVEALKNADPDIINGCSVLLIGAGGAARAVAIALIEEYACAELTIMNRTKARGVALAGALKHLEYEKQTVQTRIKVIGFDDYEQIRKAIRSAYLIINCTPLGMDTPSYRNRSPIPAECLKPEHTVFDVVYTPMRTKLLSDALTKGARVVHGTEMFLHQGAKAFELWTSRNPPLEIMKEVVYSSLLREEEI